MVADRQTFPAGIGETLTKTRAGLKGAATTPLAASANTNFDNGMTPSGWGVEQFTITMNPYGDTQDLNMVTSRVAIVGQFLQNAYVNGEQAGRTMDELARNALFAVYSGGNTRVRVTLGTAGPTIAVDDIRGFRLGFVNGVSTPTSAANPMTVTVGANVYTLTGYTADTTNISTALVAGGISGTLTFSTSVTTADATAGNTVQAATGCAIARPNGRLNTAQIVGGSTPDYLDMATLLNAVATMRSNAVPDIDGAYNCYLDPVSGRQLFSDASFRQLFQGATSVDRVFKTGTVSNFLGLRFMPTTEAYVTQHPTIPGAVVRRPIVCGAGALIEGDFEGLAASNVEQSNSIIHIVDGVAMVTREPLDRLGQIIAQSWYWIGGFCAPSDTTTTPLTVPTASNANFKRAVMIEHFG